MVDFSNLNQYQVTNDKVARITLYNITFSNGKSPVLIGQPCGQINKPYFNALMRTSAKRAIQSSGRQSAAAMAEHRSVDRDLYSKFVITGWEDIIDAQGQEVPFTVENCADFLKSIPSHIFDEIRAFFLDMNNFIEDAVSDEEALEKGNF